MFVRVGVELPTIEVRYQNLNVEAEAYVGSRGLPTILNTYANVLEVCRPAGCYPVYLLLEMTDDITD
jgi:hypothetical protein